MSNRHCAVVGTGAIGSLVAGYLIYGGEDVTMLTAFRREKAQGLIKNGLTVTAPGEEFCVSVKAAYIPELHRDERFDIIFLGLKSNDLAQVIPQLLPHLADDGCLVSLQNGINEEYLAAQAGADRVVAGVTFAGGHMITPYHVETHEGFFRVGELDGTIRERTKEIAEILSKVRPSEATEEIRGYQWDKLARVCLSVPSATISGLHLGSVFMEIRLQKLFALLAMELFEVAQADGSPRETVEGKTREEYQAILDGTATGLEGRVDDWPPGIVDAYSADIMAGRPLEIGFTNGVVVKLGKRYGIDTSVNRFMVDCILEIEKGTQTRGFHQVEKALALKGYTL